MWIAREILRQGNKQKSPVQIDSMDTDLIGILLTRYTWSRRRREIIWYSSRNFQASPQRHSLNFLRSTAEKLKCSISELEIINLTHQRPSGFGPSVGLQTVHSSKGHGLIEVSISAKKGSRRRRPALSKRRRPHLDHSGILELSIWSGWGDACQLKEATSMQTKIRSLW